MLTHRRKEKVSEPITRLLFVLYLNTILIVSRCIALHVVHSLYGLLINFFRSVAHNKPAEGNPAKVQG